MEIITSLTKIELQDLITASVRNVLKDKLTPEPELPDRIGIDEVCKLTGYLKATVYKKVFEGELPHKKFGKLLIFSRKEILSWVESQTVRKSSPVEIATAHLQHEVSKRK